MGVSNNSGTPKMDGEHNGKPYFSMDDLGGKPTIFGNIHIDICFGQCMNVGRMRIFVELPHILDFNQIEESLGSKHESSRNDEAPLAAGANPAFVLGIQSNVQFTKALHLSTACPPFMKCILLVSEIKPSM